jgi:hypothetical protein
VSVLLGVGDGTFASAGILGVGTSPSDVAIGDVDGNGFEDIVVANLSTSGLSVLLSQGGGAFSPEVRIDPGILPRSVEIADVDADSRMDIVAAAGGSTRVLFGAGGGSFPAGVTLPGICFVAVADLDGNALPDLAGTCGYHAMVLLNREGRTFLDGGSFAVQGVGASIGTGDLDGDRRPDIVVADGAGVTVLLNQGPTAFSFAADKAMLGWPPESGALRYSVYRGFLSELADVNSDGLADSGYGVCQSGLDDDLTDNDHLDPEIPLPPGNGFYYLVAVMDGDGEHGLGISSSGLARQPAIPCP